MKTKTTSKLVQDLQKHFNKFIRNRDQGLPCISCGLPKELQAGHFFAVKGYSGLRFDEYNVHGECAGCNCYNESHLIGYQDNLIERIGQEQVDLLKERAAEYKKGGHKWVRYEILEKIEHYKKLNKEFDKKQKIIYNINR